MTLTAPADDGYDRVVLGSGRPYPLLILPSRAMPELPEVETIARDLHRSAVGATVDRVAVHRSDVIRQGSAGSLRRLAGRRIDAVRRRGKFLLFDLGGRRMALHLGMSGQVFVSERWAPLADHTHLVFRLDDGRDLRHRDPRRFGFVALAGDGEPLTCLDGLGPEPLTIDARRLADLLARHRRQIKPLLMDQRVIAGIGNIYAAEILFRSRIHPLTLSSAVGDRRAGALCRAIHRVLSEAIRRNGTTIGDYVTGRGMPGGFQRFLKVYGREGEPCVRCRTPIARLLVGQRATYVCPTCQGEQSAVSGQQSAGGSCGRIATG